MIVPVPPKITYYIYFNPGINVRIFFVPYILMKNTMPNDIKPRHIRTLRELTVSQMTDEEIVKAAMDRLKSKAVMLGYLDEGRWIFSWRYKNGSHSLVKSLMLYLEGWFNCKLVKIGEEK